MKELNGAAETTVGATPEQCFGLVAAVDRYPRWIPEAIREVEVLRSDSEGRPTRVRTAVHVSAGPVARDFELTMDVDFSEHDAVCLTRVPHDPDDPERFEVVWRIAAGPQTRLAIELSATLEVPRLVPVGAVGARLAQEFIEAARRELDGSRANVSASSS